MQAHPEVLSQVRHGATARFLFWADPSPRREATCDALKSRGHEIVASSLSGAISSQQRGLLSTVDILLIDLSNSEHTILKTLEELNAAIGISNARTRLVCFSFVHRNPQFELAVKKCGARYVRISDLPVLLDAIDLVVAEMDELRHNGPSFQIIHRISQGSCAPGEEVSAIFLAHDGGFQLPAPLAERLVFDFLAQHNRIALDSLQIVSGLTAWFYRDHAANSGYRQVVKIRRARVKVVVQHLREAMASTFAQAHLRFDPCDVLRSWPAEGSKRVLYKLHGTFQWLHQTGGSR